MCYPYPEHLELLLHNYTKLYGPEKGLTLFLRDYQVQAWLRRLPQGSKDVTMEGVYYLGVEK